MKKLLFRIAVSLALAVMTLHPSHILQAQSQAEMNQKAARDFEEADASLNKVYDRVIHSLDAQGRKS